MAGFLKKAKDTMGMRQEMKKMQDQLALMEVEYSAGGGKVKVVATADMTIQRIEIDPRSLQPDRSDKLAELIVAGVNGALKAAKKKAAAQMSRMSGQLGLGGLL